MNLETVIFDVDGVLVASPHEQAWRAALQDLMAGEWRSLVAGTSYAPERFTSEVYQAYVAGKPRLSGAVSVLDYFGMVDAQARAATYAERKQQLIERLIDTGNFMAFDDAVRFARALEKRHFRMAVASSSKNAVRMLRQIDVTHKDAETSRGRSLLDLFQANVCGRDLPAGKPDPAIFLLAAHELGVHPSCCVVIEDAQSGVEAARNAGMRSIGVARVHDDALLHAAGADLVVHTLDDVSLDALQAGRTQSTTALSAGA